MPMPRSRAWETWKTSDELVRVRLGDDGNRVLAINGASTDCINDASPKDGDI